MIELRVMIMWAAVLSGLFSGLVGVLLGVYTLNRQDERQKESFKMEATKDLIYKSQIEWYDDLRKSIANLFECFIRTNHVLDKIDRLEKKANGLDASTASSEALAEAQRILSDLSETRKEFDNVFSETQGQIVLIRLYLFNLTPNEVEILKEIDRLISTYYNHNQKIPLAEVDILVEKARVLLKKQQDELKQRIE